MVLFIFSVYKKIALGYNEFMYTDAHVHILDTLEEIENNDAAELINCKTGLLDKEIFFCASADVSERFKTQEKICSADTSSFILSFGIHPQNPITTEIPFLEKLIAEKRIKAIGECGFDLFNEAYRKNSSAQKKVWDIQVRFAQKAGLPLIIHCRKALHLIFADTEKLKKIPAVIFHGWSGSVIEANSFLRKGVNAYFNIGKGLLRGQRAQIEACKNMDFSRLLTETDAPYMTLKGEDYSMPADIKAVVKKAAEIRLGCGSSIQENKNITEEFKLHIFDNFKRAFNLCNTAKSSLDFVRA